jgi:hypothetical protein
MPLLVIRWKTIDEDVWLEGWRDGQDFLLRSNDTSYMTRDIFKEYLTVVFLKYVATVRESRNLSDSPAVLLCDNCTAHIDDEIKIFLAPRFLTKMEAVYYDTSPTARLDSMAGAYRRQSKM